MLARSTTNDAAPLTVLQAALVRDCLLEDGSATLHEACNRPPWTVRLADRFTSHFFPNKLNTLHKTWKLNTAGNDGQTAISSLVCSTSKLAAKSASNLRLPLSTRGNWDRRCLTLWFLILLTIFLLRY